MLLAFGRNLRYRWHCHTCSPTRICADQVRDLTIIFLSAFCSQYMFYHSSAGFIIYQHDISKENLFIDFVISHFLTLAVVVWDYYWGDMKKFLFTLDRESVTNQSTNTTKVQLLLNQWVLLGSFRGCEWGVTYRCRNDSESAASQKPISAWMTLLKAGLQHTTHLSRLETVLSDQHGWSLLLPCSFAGESLSSVCLRVF